MDWQQPRVRLLIGTVVAAAVPVYLWSLFDLINTGYSLERWLSLIGITVAGCVSSRWVVRIPRTQTSMAVSDTLIVAVTMIYGVAPGVLAAGAFHLVSYWSMTRTKSLAHRRELPKWQADRAAFNISSHGVQAYAYGMVYYSVLPAGEILAHQIVLPVLLLTATTFIINMALMHGIESLRGRGSFRSLWHQNIPLVPLYFLASASGAAIIRFFHEVAGPWAFLLAVPILLVVYYAHLFYDEKYEEINRLFLQMVEAFANCIDALEIHTDHKGFTRNHIQRTRTATLALARALNVDENTVEALVIASMLHDVGKIAIPSYILHKPSRLDDREMLKMKTHPEMGANILSSIDSLEPVIEIVKHHHENWDGSGYPDGLKGEEIPYGSRILSVADCYEALRSRRVYRNQRDRNAAITIMKRDSHRFDPRVFEKFLEIVPSVDKELERVDIGIHLREPKEHRKNKRTSDAVGSSKAPSYSSYISEPQREVYALFESIQTIGNSLSRTETLTIVASRIEKIIPSDTLVIYMMDESKEALAAAYVLGENRDAFQGLTIEVGTRLAGWVAANNRPLYNVHPGPDTIGLPEELRHSYQNSILVPLVHEDRPLGTIALYQSDHGHYSDDDIRRMEIIANRASIALYNATIFEETKEDAFTDRLTGLPNSRFLYIFFEQSLSEAKRYSEPLTVIEMDLDDFKSVNDRYGHHSGDRLLKEVGRVLTAQMRDSDVLVRYAGDEFIAILPKTTLEQARQFSFRIQDAVEGANIDVGIGKTLSIGISLGLASYSTDGTDLESLLMAADKNMYEHKTRRKGRRRRDEELETGAHQPSLFGTEEIAGPHVG
jgi:diguanylate cyclase (GGDEF)-like protein/putative nucleotidyltransferase with HDIG domain